MYVHNFKVGDKVKVISNKSLFSHKKDKIGTISRFTEFKYLSPNVHLIFEDGSLLVCDVRDVELYKEQPKFKVGDSVRINGPTIYNNDKHFGRVGKIREINEFNNDIIYVTFDDKEYKYSNPYFRKDLEPVIEYDYININKYCNVFEYSDYQKNLWHEITKSYHVPVIIGPGTGKSPDPNINKKQQENKVSQVKLVEHRKEVTTKSKYPVLKSIMGLGNVVIMFTAPKTGFIVKSNNTYMPVGQYKDEWNEENFVEYNEEVTISNN